jgi:TolB-like protein/Flp pilus assembly protein TadD
VASDGVPGSVERRLAAVLHADVEGYSRSMASDEDATVRGVRAVRGIVEGVVRQHRGRLVDFTGDSCLAEFSSAVDAVGAALAIQRESAAQQATQGGDRHLRLRIGIHAGEVRVEDGRLFGDAIHVAARLQTLAEPGGVVISAAVHEQVAGKLPLRANDLGAQLLKNLPRPVSALSVSARAAPDAPAPVPGFSGRPAIAVLAFAPFGGDLEQEYLGDGIAEDLITRLATRRDFPVIARNSSFAYKGRSIDVKQIGRELGVAYLIEGSVRRSGSRLRITAQLVDARTGHHAWAERYDRELADVFAIQDEIVDAVLSRVYPEVMRAERHRVERLDPASLGAWELIVLARSLSVLGTREQLSRERELALRALELDPGSAEAVRILTNTQIVARVNQYPEVLTHDPVALAALARRALQLSGESWQGHLALGTVLTLSGDFAEGLDSLQRAVRLNPSSVDALLMLANSLARAGRAEEGLPLLESARRLEPTPADPNNFAFQLSLVYYAAGRLEDALRWSERTLELAPTHTSGVRLRACTLMELGRLDEARAAVAELLRLAPDFRISILEQIIPAQPGMLPRLVAALRAAGAPE